MAFADDSGLGFCVKWLNDDFERRWLLEMSGIGGAAIGSAFCAVGIRGGVAVRRPGEGVDVLTVVVGVVRDGARGFIGASNPEVAHTLGIFNPGEACTDGSSSERESI